MDRIKMLPDGIVDFQTLRRENSYYVDKTMYIPKLEEAGRKLFLIRPRRFGKSIFLSMLRSYYDMAEQDKFDGLFGGLWIHEHPTDDKGQYQVIYFDFSKASSGSGDLKTNFHDYCSKELVLFAERNEKYYYSGFADEIKAMGINSSGQLNRIYGIAQRKGYQLYLIIDEYDNFTNNILSEKGQEAYHSLTHATGFYRDVFKIYKANFQRILMMGVSPITLDDLTSGFNISTNISTDARFNMMLGFSQTEVEQMIEYYREAGVITAATEDLIAEMKPWYDNYCFSVDSLNTDPKMFNCDMVVYYLNSIIQRKKAPEIMVDPNTKTDYAKIKMLMKIDGMGLREKSILQEIAITGQIDSELVLSFPAERIYNKWNFISLLYYYGLLTMAGYDGDIIFGIPNNNVRKQYYEYMLNDFQEDVDMELYDFIKSMKEMALRGTWQPALQMIADAYTKLTSIRDAIEGERNIQGFFTAYLNFSKYYLTAPETELNHGYCDFFLMPDLVRNPSVRHSYIIELKYLGAKATDEELAEQWDKAITQIHRYAEGGRTQTMIQGTQLHLIIIQFKGYQLVRMEDLTEGK